MVAPKIAFSSEGIKCLVLGDVIVKAHKIRFFKIIKDNIYYSI
jgi:hypothetical protein